MRKVTIKINELVKRFGFRSVNELATLAKIRPHAMWEIANGWRMRNGVRTPIHRIEFEHLEKIADVIEREKGVKVSISDLIEFEVAEDEDTRTRSDRV